MTPKFEAQFIRKRGAWFVDGVTGHEVAFKFERALRGGHPHAFHGPRAEIDQVLSTHAAELGVDVRQGWEAKGLLREGGAQWALSRADQRDKRSSYGPQWWSMPRGATRSRRANSGAKIENTAPRTDHGHLLSLRGVPSHEGGRRRGHSYRHRPRRMVLGHSLPWRAHQRGGRCWSPRRSRRPVAISMPC